jgi:hypothetical protein
LPIESAPKEITHKSGHFEYGASVLVYDGNILTACWWQCRKRNGDIYGSNWIDNGANALKPTHWMPLPAPPAALEAIEVKGEK